jgi:hypothetical protein
MLHAFVGGRSPVVNRMGGGGVCSVLHTFVAGRGAVVNRMGGGGVCSVLHTFVAGRGAVLDGVRRRSGPPSFIAFWIAPFRVRVSPFLRHGPTSLSIFAAELVAQAYHNTPSGVK